MNAAVAAWEHGSMAQQLCNLYGRWEAEAGGHGSSMQIQAHTPVQHPCTRTHKTHSQLVWRAEAHSTQHGAPHRAQQHADDAPH